MLIIFLRALILYVLVIFSVRLMGKRQIGELQPSELVITILVSNIATLPIEDIDLPVTAGIVPILTLVSLDVIMSTVTLKFRSIRKLVSGSPKIIISDGIVNQHLLRELRYSADDLMESLREQGIFDLSTVQFAIVETTGKINVLEKEHCQCVKQGDIGIQKPSEDPPQTIIDDGKIRDKALEFLELDRIWLYQVLRRNNVTEQDVFLLTASRNGKYHFIQKEQKRT